MMAERFIELLIPFREFASGRPARSPQHLSCTKAGPGTTTSRANCRKIQHWQGNVRRLAEHEAGGGARLLAVVKAAGISWELARMWLGTRARERQIKRQGRASRFSPLCGITPRRLPVNADGSLSRSRTTDPQKLAAGVMNVGRAHYAARWLGHRQAVPSGEARAAG